MSHAFRDQIRNQCRSHSFSQMYVKDDFPGCPGVHILKQTPLHKISIFPKPPTDLLYLPPGLGNRILGFESRISTAVSFLQTWPLSGSQTGGMRSTSVWSSVLGHGTVLYAETHSGAVGRAQAWGAGVWLAVPSIKMGINLVSKGWSAGGEVEGTVIWLVWVSLLRLWLWHARTLPVAHCLGRGAEWFRATIFLSFKKWVCFPSGLLSLLEFSFWLQNGHLL